MTGDIEIPLSSFALMTAEAGLLVCAGILLSLTRTRRVELHPSIVTNELMICLARIADGIEVLRASSGEEVMRDVLVKLHQIAKAKPGKVREMPQVFVKK